MYLINTIYNVRRISGEKNLRIRTIVLTKSVEREDMLTTVSLPYIPPILNFTPKSLETIQYQTQSNFLGYYLQTSGICSDGTYDFHCYFLLA